MEEQWLVDRAKLRQLLSEHPTCPQQEWAARLERSLGWVKKWVRRLRDADPADETVVLRRTSPRCRSRLKRTPLVVERILAIRDDPPDNLRRVPGPKAILYYLGKDPQLQRHAAAIPLSWGFAL